MEKCFLFMYSITIYCREKMPFICAFGQFSPLGFTSAEEKGKNWVPHPAGHIPSATQDATDHHLATQTARLRHVLVPAIILSSGAPSSPLFCASCMWKCCTIIKS